MKTNDKQTAGRQSWFKLDNAAKIFPGQNSSTWSNSFRVAFCLKEDVDSGLLLKALKKTLPRFPCYDVKIRPGMFWYYLEHNDKPIQVYPDIKNPLYRVRFRENNGYLFKVRYHKNTISADFYHALTDGHGACVFLSTLTAEYLRLRREEIPVGGFVLDTKETASAEELEDSFIRYATSGAKFDRRDKFVYHASGLPMPRHTLSLISGSFSFAEFHKITRAAGVSVTEYLAAMMLDILIRKQRSESRRQKEVSIQIPADLRRAFGSETLRNFTICMRVKVDPNKGEYTFEELLHRVKYQLALENDVKEHNALITANTAIERNPLLRATPLFIKNLGVGLSFAVTAEQTTSCLITNLGKIDLPPEMERHIQSGIFFPAPGKVNGARIGVATVGDVMTVTFSDRFADTDVEREFFTALVKMGLHVKIESNR